MQACSWPVAAACHLLYRNPVPGSWTMRCDPHHVNILTATEPRICEVRSGCAALARACSCSRYQRCTSGSGCTTGQLGRWLGLGLALARGRPAVPRIRSPGAVSPLRMGTGRPLAAWVSQGAGVKVVKA